MLDLRWIRQHPEDLDRKLIARGHAPVAQALLDLDAQHRGVQTELQDLQAARNDYAKRIGSAKQAKDEAAAAAYLARANALKEEIPAHEQKERDLAAQVTALMDALPNMHQDDVPLGQDASDNVCARTWGTPRVFDFAPKHHYELGESLGLMDFEQAAVMAGARFVLLKGALARLERALISFMLDIHTREFGYEEVSPPLLMRPESVYGVGQLPKFHEDLFQTTDGRYLLSTGEVPLTNIVAQKILPADVLPLRYVAHTPCFRSEAGSAGRDTRGMIRLHQFSKVELVSVTRPEDAAQEHARMLGAAEEVLKRLGLPYRVMLLCTGDMGAQPEKTYDIEVWLPSENAFREISSCSAYGSYQARRMDARFRTHSEEKPQHVATLNGSGLPIGRTMVALLENYQEPDGAITLPECLAPYMNGQLCIA